MIKNKITRAKSCFLHNIIFDSQWPDPRVDSDAPRTAQGEKVMGTSFPCPSPSVLLPPRLLLSFQAFLLPPLPLPRPPNPVCSFRPRAAMLTAVALSPQTLSGFVTWFRALSVTAHSIPVKSWSREGHGGVRGEVRGGGSGAPDTHPSSDAHSDAALGGFLCFRVSQFPIFRHE